MARYTDAEVDEILRRAIERQQKDSSGLAHEDLVAAAREIGIEASEVEAAVAEMRAGGSRKPDAPVPPPAVPSIGGGRGPRRDLAIDDLDDDALDVVDLKSRRARFARHLASYVVVNAALAGMNLMTGGGPWVLWVILGWGIGVALHGVGLFLPEDPRRKERRRKRVRRRRAKETQRERAREAAVTKRQQRRERDKEFERAVQEGVGLLFGAARKKLGEVVAEAKAREGVRVEVDDDRVRVEPPDGDALESDARSPSSSRRRS